MFKRIVVMLVLVLGIFGTCWADSETNEVTDAYSDIYLMFNSNMSYNEFRPIYRTANLKYEKYKQKHNGDNKYSDVLLRLNYLDTLYYDIDRTWKHDIFSSSTDIRLISEDFTIYPKLNNLKKNFWGNYNTKDVMQIYMGYQQERIDSVKKASDNIGKQPVVNTNDDNIDINAPLPIINDVHI